MAVVTKLIPWPSVTKRVRQSPTNDGVITHIRLTCTWALVFSSCHLERLASDLNKAVERHPPSKQGYRGAATKMWELLEVCVSVYLPTRSPTRR